MISPSSESHQQVVAVGQPLAVQPQGTVMVMYLFSWLLINKQGNMWYSFSVFLTKSFSTLSFYLDEIFFLKYVFGKQSFREESRERRSLGEKGFLSPGSTLKWLELGQAGSRSLELHLDLSYWEQRPKYHAHLLYFLRDPSRALSWKQSSQSHG